MCGIAGVVSESQVISEGEVKRMTDELEKRGPDAEGFFVDGSVALGHRRLSVIDLESGDQPMFSDDGSVALIYNGEIYNFKELKAELRELGCTFETTSDTEVIIKGYEVFGIDTLLGKLEGMFAFALYDLNQKHLYLARDKFGEKPLYYFQTDSEFAFASELKALEKRFQNKGIDNKGLNLFLSLNYIPAPFTIYKDVKKLEAGSYISFSITGELTIKKYYNLLERIRDKKTPKNLEEGKEKIKRLLSKAVEQRMIADVPLGVFLSGGIDSSIIAALMAEKKDYPINTFSIGFKEEEYDESERAQIIADHINSNHTVKYLDYKDVVNLIDEIVLYYDEPFGDSSALPSYFVAKLAREKVTVALTGDCADELFGGYEKYLGHWYASKLAKLPSPAKKALKKITNTIPHTRLTNSVLRKIKKVLHNADSSDFDLHYNLMCLGFEDEQRKKLLSSEHWSEVKPLLKAIYNTYSNGNTLEKGFYTDLNVVLEGDMLVKMDRVCMKNSLESRIPFLDSKLVEEAFSLPTTYKIKGRNKKFILKKAFNKILPKKTINYPKKGFGIPLDYWFKNELKPELERLISPDFIEHQGIFNYEELKRIFNEHMSGAENHKGKLWNIYVFQKWYCEKFCA